MAFAGSRKHQYRRPDFDFRSPGPGFVGLVGNRESSLDVTKGESDSNDRMRNLKLIVAYDGTDFAGWQVQPDLPTIQGALAHVIGRLTGENVLPQGSGRTDAGVHALAQVATFPTASPIPAENFQKAMNEMLPVSIRVRAVEEVGTEFHARKSARAKTYRYRIYRGDICPPFLARWVWHYPYPLDEAAMARAVSEVVGEHDFTSFAAVDPEKRTGSPVQAGRDVLQEYEGSEGSCAEHSNVRRVFSSRWERQGDEFVYTVRGNGFLHHMVRNLVGTFLLVGKGTLQVEDVALILTARSRSAAGATAPASGLCLVGVEYD
jgi:tRNA pseudouridine38-40 synthase